MQLLSEVFVGLADSAAEDWTNQNIQEMRLDLNSTLLWMDWSREVVSTY